MIEIGHSILKANDSALMSYSLFRYNFEPESIDKSQGNCAIFGDTDQVQVVFGDKKDKVIRTNK